MAEAQLEATVRSQGGAAILDLRGDITHFAESALQAAYDRAEQSRPGTLVLNFSQVQYINSTGIALIVSLLARARKNRRRVICFGLSDHYREIFEVTRLADFIRLLPDEAAVQQFLQEEQP
jgi:anti-anti-sigma factor